MPGPAPKAHRQRARDERRRQAEQTVVRRDGRARGPRLPADVAYDPRTVAYYEKIRRAPQAQAWSDLDWLTITDILIPLMDQFNTSPRKAATLAGEIRQIQASLGFTLLDTRRARLQIEDQAPVADRDDVAERRARKAALKAEMAAE